jgi:hypothetical protein
MSLTFRRDEDYLGIWTLRNGDVIVIKADTPTSEWDENGNSNVTSKRDLMERKREAPK